MMKGIDRKKHEHILKCLEELRSSPMDVRERERIEQEIVSLSDIYNCYNTFLNSICRESDRYNTLYPEVQRRIYKEIRRVRRIQKK